MLVDFGDPIGREQAGYRPGVVVSVDELNRSKAGVLIVVPCITKRRNLPSHIELDPTSSGLDEVSYAKCEDVKSISEERLVTRLGMVALVEMFDIARVLRFLMDL